MSAVLQSGLGAGWAVLPLAEHADISSAKANMSMADHPESPRNEPRPVDGDGAVREGAASEGTWETRRLITIGTSRESVGGVACEPRQAMQRGAQTLRSV